MANFDESVQNLEAFIALLTATTSELHDQTSDVEEAKTELDRLADQADDDIGKLADALEEGLDELGDGADSAGAALAAVESKAQEIAQQRLGDLSGSLEDAAERGVDRITSTRERVDEAFQELKADGIDAFVNVVHELASEAQDAQGEAEQDFEELGQAIEQALSTLQEAQQDATEALDEAASAAGQESEQVGSVGEQTVAAWTGARDQLESEGAEAQGAIGEAYSGWTEDVQEAGQAAVEAVSTALSEAADAISGESADLLNEALQVAVDDALPKLSEESSQVTGAVEPGDPMAQALDPMVGELVTVQSVVDQIAQLLQEMGNS
jgi:chromosome segregation ATPase